MTNKTGDARTGEYKVLSGNHFCCVKIISIIYSECGCIVIVMQH
jgi:hypothetical protein